MREMKLWKTMLVSPSSPGQMLKSCDTEDSEQLLTCGSASPHTLAPPAPSIFSVNTSVTALHSLGGLCFSEVFFCLCVSSSLLSWISPLFSLLYPVVIRGFFPPKPIWQTSFLAFRFHLQMSEWEIMVHCRLGAVRACWPGGGDTEEQGELWSSHVGQLT